jgi:hypothetical protein
MNNYKNTAVAFALFAMIAMTLTGCSKTRKKSSAGGGSSTQSVLTFKGAAR